MRSNEWLDSYFGMPFDEVLSVAGLTPAPLPTPPPQAAPSELPSPPVNPESYSFFPTKIRREIEHPFFVVGEKIRKVMDDPFSSDSLGTYLDALGAARVLEGGGIARSVPIPRRFYNPGKFITGEAQLGPATVDAKPYRLAPPPGRREYLEAFRSAVSKGDESGAINILRNATRTNTRLPLMPDDLKSSMSPYVSRELFRNMMPGDPPTYDF